MNRTKYGQINRLWVCFGVVFLFICIFFQATQTEAAEALNEPLDQDNPVYFYGDAIAYQNQTISLSDDHIYIDGSLSDELCARYPHVYNDFKKAYQEGAIKDGTEEAPMNVYLAPYVYWLDDPDDPAIREGENGEKTPYALKMKVNHLSLNGLTEKPENVVFAVNRGQTAGAIGNYTMLSIDGTGTHTYNMTMGNYCCVDLDFPLKPSLSRPKRQTAITQSQLVLTNGSKIVAKNCNFISRLNSCPFSGGKRIFFEDCHFECTDDSLPTSAVFFKCDFDFYSSKPFYNTSGTGSVMLQCEFHIRHGANQYLTKAGGPVAIIDSVFYSEKEGQYIGWTADPAPSLRCVSGNVTVQYDYTDADGAKQQKIIRNYSMDADAPYDNVNITDTDAMDAYRIVHDGNTIYNLYNLLRGEDDWDPLDQKEAIVQAGQAAGKDYVDLPVLMNCSPQSVSLTHGETADVSVGFRAFSTEASKDAAGSVTWSVEDGLRNYITLRDNGDGSCVLTCKNETLAPKRGMIYAKAASGLASGIYVTAMPETQPAPSFVSKPVLAGTGDGSLELRYTLSNAATLDDYSSITWYRCSNAAGGDAVAVAVSHSGSPLKAYRLSHADIGYYIKAVIVPKQICTLAGESVTVVSAYAVVPGDVTSNAYELDTDFSEFAPEMQLQVREGFWTKDVYRAWITDGSDKQSSSNAWNYTHGEVGYGSEGLYGLLPLNRGARMMYTPLAGTYGDMSLTMTVNPEKNAGQGFGSAGQYMDVFIKYDAKTMTGYALRLERISTLDCGVQAALMEYKNDEATYISDKLTTSAFNAECTISVSFKGGKLSASVTTTHEESEKQVAAKLPHSIHLEAEVSDNSLGGVGVLFTGTIPIGNRVMFNHLNVSWDEKTTSLIIPDVPQQAKVNLKDVACAGIPDQTYTGKAITPSVTLTYNGRKLKEGVDYTVSYSDNVNPGTATVTMSGKGDFSGTLKKTFKICKSAPAAPKKGTAFTYKGLRYVITKTASGKKGTVAVVRAQKKTVKSLTVPATVRYKKGTYQVTAIQAKAFYNCKKLKKVAILTKDLKKVGKNAFKKVYKKCVIKVPAKKRSAYKKLLKGKGQAKTVKIR